MAFDLKRLAIYSCLCLWLMACAPSDAPPTPALPATPASEQVQIGLLLPMSGEMTTAGRTMLNGTLLAFDAWNERGGVRDQRVTWTTYDTACDIETAQVAAQRAITDGVQFVIGPLCTEVALFVVPMLEDAGVVMVAPAATHPLVAADSDGLPRATIFQVSYSYSWQAEAMAQYAADTLDVARVALLFDPTDDYASTLAAEFTAQFPREITRSVGYIPGEADFEALVAEIEATDAEAIYLPAPVDVVAQVAQVVDEELILLGSDSWDSPPLEAAAFNGTAYYPRHFAITDERDAVQTWVEQYRTSYAIAPETIAPLSYDAADLLLTAIAEADSFEAEAVAERIAAGSFEGVTGPISFDAQHRPQKPVPLLRIQAGEIMVAGVVTPD